MSHPASDIQRHEVCALACAEAFRGDGEIMASPMGLIPALGAKLAKATFEPDLMLTDGVANLITDLLPAGTNASQVAVTVEGRMPYRKVFDVVWSGRRHVMMGASQIDVYGNQNISCVGEHSKPAVQLLGVRGAPGNTINNTTSYFVAKHTNRVFVERVDMVSGIGYNRAAELGERAARFHEIRRVVSNLGVFDFNTPSRRMRLVSVHPGVTVARVVESTGFELVIADDVPTTALPNSAQLSLLRDVLDPRGLGAKGVAP